MCVRVASQKKQESNNKNTFRNFKQNKVHLIGEKIDENSSDNEIFSLMTNFGLERHLKANYNFKMGEIEMILDTGSPINFITESTRKIVDPHSKIE